MHCCLISQDTYAIIYPNILSFFLVEQNARLALSLADHGYVLETGNIVLQGDAKELQENAEVKKAYLGG